MIKKILPKEDFNSLQEEINLKKLADAISDLKSSLKNDSTKVLLEKNNALLGELIALSKKTEYGPEIINELRKNTEAILSSIKPEEEKVEDKKEEKKEEKREWKFTVKRGITGVIEEINAKQI